MPMYNYLPRGRRLSLLSLRQCCPAPGWGLSVCWSYPVMSQESAALFLVLSWLPSLSWLCSRECYHRTMAMSQESGTHVWICPEKDLSLSQPFPRTCCPSSCSLCPSAGSVQGEECPCLGSVQGNGVPVMVRSQNSCPYQSRYCRGINN